MRQITIMLMLFLLVGLMGCGSSGSEYVAVNLTGDRTIDLEKDQLLRIQLKSNMTTGYTWVVSQISGAKTLRREGKGQYIRSSDLIGAGGIQVYRFKALEKGRAELVFEYCRPWEKEKDPAERYTVQVVVR